MDRDSYDSIPKIKRLAIFLLMIEPETAAMLLRDFDEQELEAISREMVALDLVHEDLQQAVSDEFASLLVEGITSVRGGYEAALRTLEQAKGPYLARNLVGKMEPARDSQDIIQEITEMEARQIANLIKAEQPQTIAFLLGAMDVHKAAEILQLLSVSVRGEVVRRMGSLEPTPEAILNKVVKNLSRHLDSRGQQPITHFGGAARVAKVLNLVDKTTSKNVLAELEESDPKLGALVRQKMFSFNDLVNVNVVDMQRILREIDSQTLVLAMKPASATLKEKIFSALSKRAGDSLREELDFLGAVRLKEVEAAQDVVIQAVRRLEEEGEINLGVGEATTYV
ncbi:flagellar motor switch protein FliG [Ruficoccus amylovorans]|uniref:Flagellar motor switch protein FliG n=1 Tax=Ruficoccus amylovorans TaxID=1804625 RepID=A0A842HHI3_9BACT|nr:flagellar motor switch protein FliG [Ruficoccus amylovorans]MBC2595007.1 flagellar motor switch protein FliG [Ruficoccus amylovorans]